MLFENQQIPTSKLPTVEAVEFQLLPPRALRLRIIGWAIIEGVLLLPLIVFTVFELWGGLLGIAIWALQATYFYWLTNKRFYREAYAVREKDIIHTRGHWRRIQLTIPYDRVQHVEIKQGPIARAFKLGSISVYTAGTVGGHLNISDIEFAEAERIKQFIAQKAEANV